MKNNLQTYVYSVAPDQPVNYTACYSVKYSLFDLLAGSVALRSDCTDVQTDLQA